MDERSFEFEHLGARFRRSIINSARTLVIRSRKWHIGRTKPPSTRPRCRLSSLAGPSWICWTTAIERPAPYFRAEGRITALHPQTPGMAASGEKRMSLSPLTSTVSPRGVFRFSPPPSDSPASAGASPCTAAAPASGVDHQLTPAMRQHRPSVMPKAAPAQGTSGKENASGWVAKTEKCSALAAAAGRVAQATAAASIGDSGSTRGRSPPEACGSSAHPASRCAHSCLRVPRWLCAPSNRPCVQHVTLRDDQAANCEAAQGMRRGWTVCWRRSSCTHPYPPLV